MILEYARWMWLPAAIALFIAGIFLLHLLGGHSRYENPTTAIGYGRLAASWTWIAIALFTLACVADAILPGGGR